MRLLSSSLILAYLPYRNRGVTDGKVMVPGNIGAVCGARAALLVIDWSYPPCHYSLKLRFSLALFRNLLFCGLYANNINNFGPGILCQFCYLYISWKSAFRRIIAYDEKIMEWMLDLLIYGSYKVEAEIVTSNICTI